MEHPFLWILLTHVHDPMSSSVTGADGSKILAFYRSPCWDPQSLAVFPKVVCMANEWNDVDVESGHSDSRAVPLPRVKTRAYGNAEWAKQKEI